MTRGRSFALVDNRRMLLKLVVVAAVMFGFGYALVPMYRAICEALGINVLSLDEKKVVVESQQPTLIKALKDWGFDPIPCDFMSYGPFGGAFHCATLDIRRRGGLQSYF